MSAVEKFPILLSEAEEESSAVPPCFSDEGINVRISFLFEASCQKVLLIKTIQDISNEDIIRSTCTSVTTIFTS